MSFNISGQSFKTNNKFLSNHPLFRLILSQNTWHNLNPFIEIAQILPPSASKELSDPYYFILLFDGFSSFSIDFTEYECSGKSLLFLSPYQLLQWHSSSAPVVDILKFHGDFYCIEYHKEEVACNGILFNNIYQQPYIVVSDHVFEEISSIFQKIKDFEYSTARYDLSIMKSYLQLILALSSKEKQVDITHDHSKPFIKESVLGFQNMLENHFLETKSVSFYADRYGLSIDAFSKKVKKYFGKPPSKLIQERLTLEAKKMLHLTHKNVKEIAADLNFEDEFYFSRYFKKEVGISPKIFREKVGISIVAK